MNTTSSWGNSTGFGQPAPSSNSTSNNPSSGLFGNSSSGAATSSFGFNKTSTAPQQSTGGGLFGNSNASGNTNQPSSAPGGFSFGGQSNASNSGSNSLFGNSNTNNAPGNASSNPAGGLFGNSSGQSSGLFGGNQANATKPGGLFGNSNTQSGGLFGGSNNNGAANTNTSSGGLFGSSAPKPGLFGSTQQQPPASGGLFGNSNTSSSNTNSGTQPGGLFSKPAASGGLFGNSNTQSGGLGTSNTQSGGLFGNSNTQSGGLFGNSNTQQSGLSGNTQSGGLFGNSSSNNGLFGNSNQNQSQNTQQVSVSGSNPYGADSILSSIMNSEQNMPQSITNSLLEKSSERKRSFASSTSSKSRKNQTILGKLAQTFNIFRTTTSSVSDTLGPSLKGIFTQQNFVNDIPASTANARVEKPTKRNDTRFNPQTVGSIKKLVINSKPSKFHLIDADKVFKAKRRRVITPSVGDARRGIASSSDDELSDIEDVNPALPNKKPEIIAGESTKNSEIASKDVTDVPEMNDGYFCSPTIKSLIALTPQQLTEVPNFIVGRVGHGQIAYNFPVDCSELVQRCDFNTAKIAQELFGGIVKIDGSVVRVYDDVNMAPPAMGFELNVPATITLRAPPKKNMSIDDHIRRLQNITGMDFITFDPITYNWTFKVKHFSVWGLLDDGQEEGDEAEEKSRLRALKEKQDAGEVEATRTYSRLYENDLYHTELKRQKIERSTSGLPGGWEFDTTAKSGGSLAIKQNLVQNEINREVNNFKENRSAIILATNASDITDTSDEENGAGSSNEMLYDGPLPSSETKNYDYLKQIVSVLPPNTDMGDLVDERAYEPDIEDEGMFDNLRQASSLPTSKNWLLQLELANDLNSALAPALTYAKKPQSAMDAVNEILFSDMTNDPVDLQQASTPKHTSHEPRLFIEEATSIDKSSMIKAVQSLLLKSNITSRENKFPHLEFQNSLNFKTLSAIFSHDEDAQFLDLVSILFDTPDISALAKYSDVDFTNIALVKRLETLEKRALFASWLQKYNRGVNTSKSTDELDRVFSKLCSGELKAAVEVALSSRNNHLATLLTLLDSNDSAVRSIASGQLDFWATSESSAFVPEAIIKIYKLLAGQYESFRAELPHDVYLGLHVYYGNQTKPLETLFKEVGDSLSHDKLSDVLKIYTSFKSATLDETLDVINGSDLSKLVRWGLSQILSSQHKLSGSALHDSIASTFGLELQKAGLWKEAIYVFASMNDDDSVKQNIRRAVIDNVEDLATNQASNEEYLVTVLGVPRGLVYEAIAVQKEKRKDIWGSGEALVIAEMWEQAHDLIVKELGPHAVVEDNAKLKPRLQTLIDSFPNGGAIIPSWNQGAGLFSKYFAVLEANEDYALINNADLDFLLTNCALLPSGETTIGKACYKIMARTIGDLAIEQREKLSDVSQRIKALTMGENEKVYFEGRLAAAGL